MKRLLFIFALLPMMVSAQTLEPATASQVLEFGPLVDSTDASTETGLAPIADTEFTVCQDGGSCAAKSDTTDATHLGDGVYAVTYNATDTTADDHICVLTDITGVLARKECYPIESSAFKDLRNGTTSLMTSRQAGNMNETTVATAPTTTTVTLTVGASNNNAYDFTTIEFVGGTEECVKNVTAYVGSTKLVTYDSACGFTVAPADIVRIHVGAAGKAVQDVDIAVAALNDPTAAAIVNEWESQSQADPTGFHINQLEVAGTAQTANDNGADINAILVDTGTTIPALIAALNDLSADDVWDEVIEIEGVTYTGRCLLAALGAYVGGTVNTVGNTSTYQDTGGNSDRISGTVTASGRGSMSITCP
jgi:hypothetical protein